MRKKGSKIRSRRCSGIGGPPFVTWIAAWGAIWIATWGAIWSAAWIRLGRDLDGSVRRAADDLDGDGRSLAVAARVLEEVAAKPPEQALDDGHGDRLPVDLRAHPGSLLGEEGEHVHGLRIAKRIRGVEAGGGEELLDELVELRDVALDARAPLRIALQQLDRHPDTGERGAELMRRPGEDMALRIDETLDPVRGPVEALREAGDLVPSLHLDPRGERARPELVDLRLQPLEPPREPAGKRPHPDRDGRRKQGERPQP